jgi:hypothetical protein
MMLNTLSMRWSSTLEEDTAVSLDTATAERAGTARTDALRTVCAFNFWPPNVDLAVKQTQTTMHIH